MAADLAEGPHGEAQVFRRQLWQPPHHAGAEPVEIAEAAFQRLRARYQVVIEAPAAQATTAVTTAAAPGGTR